MGGGDRLAVVAIEHATDDGTGGLGGERSGRGDRQREPEHGGGDASSYQRSAPKDGKEHEILTLMKAARTRVELSALKTGGALGLDVRAYERY